MKYVKYFVLGLVEVEDQLTMQLKPKEMEFNVYVPSTCTVSELEQYLFNFILKNGYQIIDILEFYEY